MVQFRPATWLRPKTVAETKEILKNQRAQLLAGGTGVYELAKRGMLPETDTIVDLQGLDLRYVKVQDGEMRIGALSNFSWLLEQDALRRPDLAGLREAIGSVRPVQVRNAATAGGAVAIALPFLDFPPAALAFDAKAVISSNENDRIVPLERFWLDYLLPDIKKGELVTELRIPLDGSKVGSAFIKLGRTEDDFALVNVCVRLSLEEGAKCKAARVALGGVASTPIRAKEVEAKLEGQKVDEGMVRKAVEPLSRLNPTPTIHGSPWYKREIAKVIVRDALLKSLDRAAKA